MKKETSNILLHIVNILQIIMLIWGIVLVLNKQMTSTEVFVLIIFLRTGNIERKVIKIDENIKGERL